MSGQTEVVASEEDPTQVQIRWGLRIPMRDGACLAATLYTPAAQPDPSAAIFTLTPYIAQFHHNRGVYFASHGYPFLAVDVRGRGNSDGVFSPLRAEAKDGADVVEWLARQSFCNGKVAMWGGSYEAYAQWVTASERPPHLVTIVPVASAYIGIDFPMRCNIPEPYLMQWLTLVAGRASQERMFFNNELFWGRKFAGWLKSGRPFKELDTIFGDPSNAFQEWVAHPQLDDYWDSFNPTAEDYAALDIPILTITGIYDADQPGALTHYQHHMRYGSASARARHYLVIGPWDHAGTRTPQREFVGVRVGEAAMLDLPKLHLDWYAWTVQNGPKPAFLRKNVAYYVMGAEEWRYADTLEAITASHKPLYLGSSGNPTDVFHSGYLSDEMHDEHRVDQYLYDPDDTTLASLESTVDPESRTDLRMLHAAAGKHLVYHTAPLREPLEVCGFFQLTLWLSIDTPDTDFRASIYEIDVDGQGVLLSSDWIRARYRESLRAAALVRTLDPLRYEFERFTFVARRLEKGSRLRLVIGPINSIYSQKNYNSGGTVAEESSQHARIATVRLFHDRGHPSALSIPLADHPVPS